MLSEKLKLLKNLQRQMHCLMAKGLGDDEDSGEDAMESVADGAEEGKSLEKKVAEATEEATDGMPDELAKERKSFFKRSGKLSPKKSAMIVMKVGKSSPPGGKFDKMSRKYG